VGLVGAIQTVILQLGSPLLRPVSERVRVRTRVLGWVLARVQVQVLVVRKRHHQP
jgi:hypothetical protein